MLLFSTATRLSAQVDPPANPDFPASPLLASITSIQNTGNDTKPKNADFWHVNCWDGVDPSWSFVINNGIVQTEQIFGTNSGQVTDPDIVLSTDLQWVRIVYVLDGQFIQSELWRYNGSIFVYQSTQTLSNEGLNPNIDVNDDDRVAVTYQDLSLPFVYGYVEQIDQPLIGPVLISQDGQRPDVAISNVGSGLGQIIVSFAYVDKLDFTLVLSQHRYTTLLAGSGTPVSLNLFGANGWDQQSGTMGTPRIAHNWYNTTSPGCLTTQVDWHLTCAVVVDFRASNNNEYIFTLTRRTNTCTLGGTSFHQGIANLAGLTPAYVSPQQNRRPVVSYCGDVIIVSWQYSGSLVNTLLNDILVWRLRWDGLHWGLNDYSRVNDNIVFGQVIPSVSGRYNSSGASSSDCYYLFVDQPSDRLYFKGSYYHNFNLRSEQIGANGYEKLISSLQTEGITIFPNPAVDMLKVEGLTEETNIQVFDRLGRKKLEKRCVAGDNQVLFPVSMPSGIYILELQQGKQEVKRFSFIKQ